jgi:hypothetical protein
MNYDRNNPDYYELLRRLIVYSQITHGIESYPLSKAEAQLLVDELEVDPTPYCRACLAKTGKQCECGPIPEND